VTLFPPITRAVALLVALLLPGAIAFAQQQGPDWFVPGQQQRPVQRPAPAKPAARPAAQPAPPLVQVPPLQPPPGAGAGAGAEPGAEANEALPQAPLPPPPELPPMPKGTPPPVATMGVLGVPDVMRVSTAAQQVEKAIGERRDRLNQDAQKEQASWRDLQQALASQRGTLTPEQIRNREKELQERITNAQKQFRDRNKIIQEAAQYSLAQIERTLVAVIRQVADARGMNLVLHRAQVALNINEFDITQDVADQLNKALPSVVIPADGVSPSAAAAGAATAAQAAPGQTTPAHAATAVPASATSGASSTPSPAVPKQN
jgi:Skp family chaperone for outer membrane proteins